MEGFGLEEEEENRVLKPGSAQDFLRLLPVAQTLLLYF